MGKQASVEDVLSLIAEEKHRNPDATINLKALLEGKGFNPNLTALNFHIDGPDGTVIQWRPQSIDGKLTTKSSVPRRSHLLRNIDFTGIVMQDCPFDQCDLTGSILPQQINHCSFKQAVLDQTTIHNSTFTNCNLEETSFDQSNLAQVTFDECTLNRTSFNFLSNNQHVSFHIHSPKQFVDVNMIGCQPGGISIENTGSAEFEVQNLTASHPVKLVGIKYHRVSDRPKILLPWNNTAPGIAAALTEKQLQRNDLIKPDTLNPIRVNYQPAGINLKALDSEISGLTKLAKKRMTEIEVGIRKQARLIAAESSETKFQSYQGMDEEQIFTELWREKKESHAMSIFYIMRNENDAASQAGQKLPYPEMDKIFQHAKAAYAQCDGLVIPGGTDIDPRFYGEDKGKTTRPSVTDSGEPDLRRDALELSLIYIQQRSAEPKPLHAICRGSQLIAAAYGAKMHQEIGDEQRDSFYIEPMQFSPSNSPGPSRSPSPDRVLGSPVRAASPSHASVSLATLQESDEAVMNLIFFHHQGFTVVPTTHGLVTIAESSTKSGTTLTTAAEYLPQNIGIVQSHPEFAHAEGLGGILSDTVAKRFFENVATMAKAFANGERKGISNLRALMKNSGDITVVEAQKPVTKEELNTLTKPSTEPAKSKDYDTIIIGLGPVGLASAIAAIERGEKVAFVTDRPLHGGLGVRQQVLGVDEVMDWVTDMVRPEILNFFLKNNRLSRVMYDPHDGTPPYPYWTFSTGALEDLLVAELDERINDKLITQLEAQGFFYKEGTNELLDELQLLISELSDTHPEMDSLAINRIAFRQYLSYIKETKPGKQIAQLNAARSQLGIDIIEVDKIPPNMTTDIDLSSGLTFDTSEKDSLLRPSAVSQVANLKKLREHIHVAEDKKVLTLGGIQKVNDQKVTKEENRQAFGFHDVVAANGAKQQAEKAMAGRITGDNVHLTQPLYKSHVATIFSIKGTTTFNFGKDRTPPKKLESRLIGQMLDHCKTHKEAKDPVAFSELRKFGWEPHSRPHQQVYTTGGDNPTEDEDLDYLYIGCEYPEAIKPERLKEYTKIIIASRKADVDAKTRTAYQAIPEKIRLVIEASQKPLDKLNDNDFSSMSKALAREWSRMLLKDALPAEVCVYNNLADPQYKASEKGKAYLSTSQFDLGFFELGRSIVPLGSRENGRAFFVSLGDGRMFPLYTTGTGAQTGLKLAQQFHHAKSNYQKLLLVLSKRPEFRPLFSDKNPEELDQKKCESHADLYNQYLDEVERAVGYVYGMYHSNSRDIIDNIRDVQAKWINARNQRFQKAEQVFEVLQDAIGLEERIEEVIHACDDVSGVCRIGLATSRQPTLHAALTQALRDSTIDKQDQLKLIQSLSAINQKMEHAKQVLEHAYTQYRDNEFFSYEELPQQSMKFDATVEQYNESLRQVCLDLREMHEMVSNISDAVERSFQQLSPRSSKQAHDSKSNVEEVLQKVKLAGEKMEALLECGLYKKHIPKSTVHDSADEHILRHESRM